MVKRGLLLAGVITLFAALLPLSTYADETASSTFSIDVSAAALQVTAPATASIELNPTSSSAVFGSTNITVNVATNNTTGYTITMSVPTTDLIHSEITGNNAPVIPSLQSSAPQSTFPSNAWGYKVTGDKYNPILLSNTNPSWQTENPTNGTDHIITLAAKVDGTKHSGTYTNTLTFNVVANPISARDIITFDANGGTGSMDGISIPAGDTVTLPQNTFTAPEGYRFSGWNAVQTNVSPNKNTSAYTNKAPYTAADTGINRQITLYAEWTNLPCTSNCDDPAPDPTTGAVGTTLQRAYEIAYTAAHKGMWEEDTAGSNTFHYVDSWNGETYDGDGRDVRFLIQDMTPEICASATALNSEAFVLDIRDQTSYHIVKAQDGRCWMQDKLMLNPTVSATASNMNSLNTNAPDEAIYNYTHGNTTAPTGWTTTAVQIRNSNFTSPEGYTIPMINTASKDMTRSDISNPDDTNINANNWKFGVYYNICAVSAGTYCYPEYQSSKKPNTYLDIEYDICPKGWRLPTGGPVAGALNGVLGGEQLRSYYSYYQANRNYFEDYRNALHVSLAGYFYDHYNNHYASYLYEWSATYRGDNEFYYLYGYANSRPDFVYYDDAGVFGYSARCIAK